MMMVEINEATLKEEPLSIEVRLPIWKWKIIVKRADALYEGDIGKCLSQLLDVGFMTEIRIMSGVKKDGPMMN